MVKRKSALCAPAPSWLTVLFSVWPRAILSYWREKYAGKSLFLAAVLASAQAPNPPPPPPPDLNWQNLLGADPALQTDTTKIATSETTVAANLPLPPGSGRPDNLAGLGRYRVCLRGFPQPL